MLLLSFIEKIGYTHADYIVGTMPNLKEHVESTLKKEATNCLCIPQGINLDFYKKKAEFQTDIEYYTPENKFIVAYAGTLNRNNPIDILLQVAKELKVESKLFFLILGDGDQKKRLVEEYGYLTNLKFMGRVEKTQVNAFLERVDLCFDAIDSKIAKFGISRNKWIDYMYAEKPIVCSYSGFKSMLNEADCGSFVPFGDVQELKKEIIRYMNLPNEKIEKIGKNGRKFLVENRTFTKLADEYIKLF
jgi:glycosyltransferase involved in cell wall biosynthesis